MGVDSTLGRESSSSNTRVVLGEGEIEVISTNIDISTYSEARRRCPSGSGGAAWGDLSGFTETGEEVDVDGGRGASWGAAGAESGASSSSLSMSHSTDGTGRCCVERIDESDAI